MTTPVLACQDICKSYRQGVPVLNRLNIRLSGGKIVGLLGPNGCGKSTLIKMIAGLLTPDSGEIYICGEPRSEESNKWISYLPERTYLTPSMKVSRLLDYFADFYEDFDRKIALKMLADMNIDPNARMSTLSKGMKEKVQLVVVMARRAKLYLLDEPIAGVDPAARDYILQTIIGNYNPEAAVIITTHLIHDVEPILDEFAFLGYGGQVLLSGTADEVRAAHGKSLDELFKEVFRCYASY